MQKSEKFFIFSWKELTVIVLLVIISLGFFFTLGLHYGKKIHPQSETAETQEAAPKVTEGPETLPTEEALDEASQHAAATAQETIKAATQEELDQSGLKVDRPKAVDLPKEKTVGKSAPYEVAKKAEKAAEKSEEEAAPAATPVGRFAIQLGSYATQKEATAKISIYQKRGLHTETRTAVVNGQTRYRVVVPGFKTKALADQKGKELHGKKKVENFIVIKSE